MENKDVRAYFTRRRVGLSVIQSYIDISAKYGIKLTILDKDFAEQKTRGELPDIYVSDYKWVLSVMMFEIALYYKEQGKLYCIYTSFLDYSMTKDGWYDYDSKRYGDTTGNETIAILSKYYKVPKINGYQDAPMSAYQLLYKNKDYYNKEIKDAVCYDRNSSFTAEMNRNFINFEDLGEGVVKEGMFGLTELDIVADVPFLPTRKGYQATHRFVVEEVPEGIHRFIKTWYDKKKNATDKKERNRAKKVLNLVIGAFQNRNWAYRALIVAKSNEYIWNLITMLNEKYNNCVIYANTDSICVDRSKLPNRVCEELNALLGTELGDMKIEHTGTVYLSPNAYQWKDEEPTWNGVNHERFAEFERLYGRKFYLGTKGDMEKLNNIDAEFKRYCFDKEQLKIVAYNE